MPRGGEPYDSEMRVDSFGVDRKTCTKCGIPKLLPEFDWYGGSRNGRRAECKACSLERHKAWKRDNPEKALVITRRAWNKRKNDDQKRDRDRKHVKQSRHTDHGKKVLLGQWLKANYGLSNADFEAMQESQNNRCAICGSEPANTDHANHRLHVDHDHKTGVVRGLL